MAVAVAVTIVAVMRVATDVTIMMVMRIAAVITVDATIMMADAITAPVVAPMGAIDRGHRVVTTTITRSLTTIIAAEAGKRIVRDGKRLASLDVPISI